MLFAIFRYWCIFYIVYVQSRDATCEEYSRADSSTGSSVTPEIEDVTSLIPLQKSCESDGEAVPFFFCVGAKYSVIGYMQYFTTIKDLNYE